MPTLTYQAIFPLIHTDLEPNGIWPLAAGFTLCGLPAWLRDDGMVKELSSWDRDAIRAANHALAVSYPADSIGAPDPERPGHTMQERQYELGVLANLALWLSRPSPASMVLVAHVPGFHKTPLVQRIEAIASPLLCHPDDIDRRVGEDDLPLARVIHEGLVRMRSEFRDGTLWTAARATWAGLQMNNEAVRYILFWVAIEALFGPEDGQAIRHRISRRLAAFLGQDDEGKESLFRRTKAGYKYRSRAVHGRWELDPEATPRMGEVEKLVRDAFLRILPAPDLIATFSGEAREGYLAGLPFTPPAEMPEEM